MVPNRQKLSQTTETIHSRLSSRSLPKEEKMIWNLRKPGRVKEAKEDEIRRKKEQLDDDIMNFPSSKVPRRTMKNDLLRVDSESDSEATNSRPLPVPEQPIKRLKIVRGKSKKR